MRRRTFLTGAIALVAGCVGGGGGDSPDGTATATPAAREFREWANRTVDGPTVTTGADVWRLEYYADLSRGEQFRRLQGRIGEQFAALGPEGVRLEVTALHECQTITWTVSPDLVESYERGDLGEAAFAERIRGTTQRESNC